MASSRKRPLVLVVEDDPALGDVICTALKDDGLDCQLAHDGDEAMRDVDDLQPAAMVLDLMMPRRDGFSVLRELGELAVGESREERQALQVLRDALLRHPADSTFGP